MMIHANNQGCITLLQNPVSHSRAKHMDIRHHFICEEIENNKIDLKFCPTKDMLANILTKGLSRKLFERFRAVLGLTAKIHLSGSDGV